MIQLKPPKMTIADLAATPLYNKHVRAQGFPPPVETPWQQTKAADALLLGIPEDNYSISRGRKNAIDWASGPPDQPFASDHRRRRRDGGKRSSHNPRRAVPASFSAFVRSTPAVSEPAQTRLSSRLLD